MDIVGRPGRAFYVEEHGVPPYDQLIYVAHRDRAGDPRLARFLDATEKAVLFLVNHPDEAWALFASHHREVDDELNGSEERRVGKECVRTCRSRWSPYQ